MARLALHAASRPSSWRGVGTARVGSLSLGELARAIVAGEVLLVESLGTWLADRMSVRFESSGEAASLDARGLEAEANFIGGASLASAADTIVVGEEVGRGLVPAYPSGRNTSSRSLARPSS